MLGHYDPQRLHNEHEVNRYNAPSWSFVDIVICIPNFDFLLFISLHSYSAIIFAGAMRKVHHKH